MPISAGQLQQAVNDDLSAYIDVEAPTWDVDADPTEVACYLLRDSLVRKWIPDGKISGDQRAAALEKFRAVNRRLAGWSLNCNTSADEELVGAVRRRMYQFWERYDPDVNCCVGLVNSLPQLFDEGRAGPGKSSLARGEDLYTKMFDSPLSSTSRLSKVWMYVIPSGAFQIAEIRRALKWGTSAIVDESKLDFVPKNVSTARTIAIEPTINMWFQLGLGEVLSSRLRELWNIDIPRQQAVQRSLAEFGSRTEQLATLDLSSASDSISLKMLELILPPSFVRWLKLLRCDKVRLPDGSSEPLHMVSTMGNGYTFALETVVFAGVVLGVYDYLGIRPAFRDYWSNGRRHPRNIGVYGDDIICVTESAKLVIRVLSLLGFELNAEKSFVEGPFRESCGGDFYRGSNVRPVFLKSLAQHEDSFVALNRLNQWTARHGVVLRNLSNLIMSGVKRPDRFLVPMDEQDNSGIRVPSSLALLGSRVKRKDGLLHYSVRVPREVNLLFVDNVVWCTEPKQKARDYNPDAHLVCAIGGYIVSLREQQFAQDTSIVRYLGDVITLRQRKITYRTKRRSTPQWDRVLAPSGGGFTAARAAEVWAVEANLFCWFAFGTVG